MLCQILLSDKKRFAFDHFMLIVVSDMIRTSHCFFKMLNENMKKNIASLLCKNVSGKYCKTTNFSLQDITANLSP